MFSCLSYDTLNGHFFKMWLLDFKTTVMPTIGKKEDISAGKHVE